MQPPEIDHHRAKTQEQQHNLTLTHTLWQSTVKLERGKAGILLLKSGYGAAFSQDFQDQGSSGRCCFQLDFLLNVSAAAGLCLACTDNPPITAAAEQSGVELRCRGPTNQCL